MNCLSCGARLENTADKCGLCAVPVDREAIYALFFEKGLKAGAEGDADRELFNFLKAAEAFDTRKEICLKLAGLYENKGDTNSAIQAYFRALTSDFYDEKIHGHIILMYSRRGRGEELKKWYEKNREYFDGAFIDKHIKMVDNVRYFSTEVVMEKPVKKNASKGMVKSFKQYIILNVIFGIMLLFLSGGVAAVYYFKLDINVVIAFAGIFFFMTVIVLFYYRLEKIKKIRQNRPKPEDYLK